MVQKKKIFRFEEMWLSDKGCSDTIEAVWLSSDFDHTNHQVLKKLEKCGVELTKWSRENFGNVRNELEKKRRQLAEAEMVAMNFGLNIRVRGLKDEIEILLDKENWMWLQCSKTLWAVQGDRNTRFFHSKATNRYRKNFIHKLRNTDGQWSANNEEVADILIQYYKELFTSTNPTFPKEVLLTINPWVSAQMNNRLSADFKAWEIHEVVKQMAPLKAPGPDGMPPIFFQNFWPLVGDEVTASVLIFLNTATFLCHLNHTFISLIPKVKNPELVSEFRPISLCNVLYKIFSKVLANRLKKVLPTLITEHQSAFTKSRLISDNILVAFESLHSM